MRLLVYAITCLILLSLPLEAQTFGHALRGLATIRILIERLDDNSLECGLTEAAIQNAILYPISAANIGVTDSANEFLCVNATSLFFSPVQWCVTNINMRAEANQNVKLDYSHRTVFTSVELWSDGGIYSTVRSDHARDVTGNIEDLAKKFVTAWNLDNKPAEHWWEAPVVAPVRRQRL